jgi:small subunit ribosomal protein S7
MEEKLLLFNRWDLTQVNVDDQGLQGQINLNQMIIPRTSGRFATTEFHKSKINIVERFINRLRVPGHRGKNHKITSGRCPENTPVLYKAVKEAFEIIEKKTGKNPVQTLVAAIENSAILEEVASYRLGGTIARKAVVVSPQRRLDLALRFLTQGIYKTNFKNKRKLSEVIADELLAAASGDTKSFAVGEKNRLEREAEGAR